MHYDEGNTFVIFTQVKKLNLAQHRGSPLCAMSPPQLTFALQKESLSSFGIICCFLLKKSFHCSRVPLHTVEFSFLSFLNKFINFGRGCVLLIYRFSLCPSLFCWVTYSLPYTYFFGHTRWLTGDLCSPARDCTWALAVEVLSPNHWTPMEFPVYCSHCRIFLVRLRVLLCSFPSSFLTVWHLTLRLSLLNLMWNLFSLTSLVPCPVDFRFC